MRNCMSSTESAKHFQAHAPPQNAEEPPCVSRRTLLPKTVPLYLI
jgi:hypothetical protein